MFNLKYPDGAALKKLLYGSIKPLSEVPMKVDQTSLTVRALSPDKNIMVDIYVPSTAFETYDVTSDTLVTGDRDDFLKAVRRGTKKDVVNLRYEDGADLIHYSLINTKTGAERVYRVRVLDYGKELIQALDLDLPVKAQITTDDLKKLINDAKIVGEELELRYSGGKLTARSASEGREFLEVLEQERPLISLTSSEEDAAAKYDVDLLRSVAPALEIADAASLEFGSGYPLKVELRGDDGSRVTIWVAPRA